MVSHRYRFAFCLLFALCAHCTEREEPTKETDDELAGSSTHCWAEIMRPLPSDPQIVIGTKLELRAEKDPICPQGVTERLVYRFFVEGPSGRIAVQDEGVWSTSRFSAFDTKGLTPGKYRLFVYSLPSNLEDGRLATETSASNLATRSSYTYVTLTAL
jgi:hypothetical protein